MGLASLVLLTGCSSQKKVSYEEFHEKAVEAAKLESGYTTATVNGKITVESTTMEFKDVKIEKLENGRPTSASLPSMTDANYANVYMAIMLISEEAYAVPDEEDDKVTWYVGGGFKAVYKDDKNKATITWDKYGLMTSEKAEGEDTNLDIKVKYSK